MWKDFLKQYDRESPLDKEILDFMSQLETEKLYERAAEWIENIPRATKRQLYTIPRGDVLPHSAYEGNHQKGLKVIEMKNFERRIYVGKKRESYSIETDMLVCDYNRVPMEELEPTGIFKHAGDYP